MSSTHTSHPRGAKTLMALLAVVIAVTVAAIGCGSPTVLTIKSMPPDTAAGEITLAYTYSTGATYTHEATTIATSTVDAALLSGGERSVTTEETSRERRTATVQTAEEDGLATLAVTFETVETTADGVPQAPVATPQKSAVITIDTTGKVVYVAGVADDAGDGSLDSSGFAGLLDYLDTGYDLTAVIYPDDGAARVGDEWSGSYSIPLPGMLKELTLTATGELVSVSSEDGRQTAVIEHTSSLPLQVTLDLSEYFREILQDSSYAGDLRKLVVKMTIAGEITYTGTSTVDTGTGQIITASGHSEMAVTLTYSEAPEDLIPSGQRGPFAMDASGEVTISATH